MIFNMKNLFIFFLTLLISYAMLSLSINFLSKYLVDLPNSRSSHIKKKPRGGGFIFVFNSIFISIINLDISLLLSIPLAFVGLIDDKINLSSKIRFFSQISTIFCILLIVGVPAYFAIIPGYFIIPFLILFGVSLVNFSNFMDGIDGLVAGCFCVIFAMASLSLDNSYIPIASSLLAFLFFNWEPSKLFMGDIGSTFLGSIFFTVLIKSKNIEEFFSFLMISSPLMFDAFTCVIRRYLKGKDIFSPHRDHLYQRLCDNNISHSMVSLIYILPTIIISLTFLIYGIKACFITTLFSMILGILIDKKFAIKFI